LFYFHHADRIHLIKSHIVTLNSLEKRMLIYVLESATDTTNVVRSPLMARCIDTTLCDKICQCQWQCLMDSSGGLVTNIIGNNSDTRADIEEISRNLIYDIHIFRHCCLRLPHYTSFQMWISNGHKVMTIGLMLWCLLPLSTIFQLYHGINLIDEGNLSPRKKSIDLPQATDKLYHIMWYRVSGSELATLVMIGTDCICSCKSIYCTTTKVLITCM
jgi:hypothetical protein